MAGSVEGSGSSGFVPMENWINMTEPELAHAVQTALEGSAETKKLFLTMATDLWIQQMLKKVPEPRARGLLNAIQAISSRVEVADVSEIVIKKMQAALTELRQDFEAHESDASQFIIMNNNVRAMGEKLENLEKRIEALETVIRNMEVSFQGRVNEVFNTMINMIEKMQRDVQAQIDELMRSKG